MRLKILPSHIANLIAAGEVVQRPSSVVKELLENAIDAGGENIEVIIQDSGRTLIQVIDDGSGLSPEEAKLAFARHATSKIEEIEDIGAINTFGFRGEALASICSVAEVTLRTKREGEESGYQVKFAESKLLSEEEVAAPKGSNFMVRNLFYNIPARRKFLKSDRTEFRQIYQEFTRVALTRPHLSLTLIHDGKLVIALSPAPLKKRIQELMGREVANGVVELSLNTSLVKISGYIGKPEEARKSPGNQFLFVNNRYFRSNYFHKAILKGYEGLIKAETLPAFFINFEVDSSKIDINIHPAKTEVKFEDDYAIFDLLTSAVKEVLGKNAFVPAIEFDMEGAPEIPRVKMGHYVAPPKIDYDPLFNPFDQEKRREELKEDGASIDRDYHNFNQLEGESALFGATAIESRAPLQMGGRYIITTIKSGLLIINIGRAKERILYERFLSTLKSGESLSQQSLFPMECPLSFENLSIIRENESTLKKMGFDITPLENSISINGLPQGFNENPTSLPSLIDSLIYQLSQDGRDFSKKSQEQLAQELARSGSAGRLDPLNSLEALALIDRLFACSEPNYTPSGAKTFITLAQEEIERKLF